MKNNLLDTSTRIAAWREISRACCRLDALVAAGGDDVTWHEAQRSAFRAFEAVCKEAI